MKNWDVFCFSFWVVFRSSIANTTPVYSSFIEEPRSLTVKFHTFVKFTHENRSKVWFWMQNQVMWWIFVLGSSRLYYCHDRTKVFVRLFTASILHLFRSYCLAYKFVHDSQRETLKFSVEQYHLPTCFHTDSCGEPWESLMQRIKTDVSASKLPPPPRGQTHEAWSFV